ncbi:Nonribosomal peptide synthetases (NRPS) [Penicillium maclennaniae]|uniref:Nonribosomal peptide synthetases (NRPS) n=1 Tax=Penicillium maclennaniae TaxID=1343394 RepID=UPI002540E1D5|nr:Nonribosomal peptide synthetases (NRPS) [Penicillium maclennaniae]KAJ5676560.1 Nonribosomal peptide synthetases (NRPS) [Penicillium maclennaniae]
MENSDKQSERCCFFPALNGAQPDQSPRQRQQQVIELDGNVLQAKVDQTRLFHLAWGVVLRLYTACDDIVFLYVHSGKHEKELYLCDFELSSASTFSDLIPKTQHESPLWKQPLEMNGAAIHKSRDNFNTALHWIVDSKNDPSVDAASLWNTLYAEVRDLRDILHRKLWKIY